MVGCVDGRMRSFVGIYRAFCRLQRQEREVDSNYERLGTSSSTDEVSSQSVLPDTSAVVTEETRATAVGETSATAVEDSYS